MRLCFPLGVLIFVAAVTLSGLLSSCQDYQGAAQQDRAGSSDTLQQMSEEMPQLSDHWVKSTVPLGKWGQVVAFANDGRVVLAGRGTILTSLDDGKKIWKLLSGGEGSHRSTFDGGNTYRKINQLGESLSSSIEVREFCSPESAVITPSGRLYVKTVCEHITQLWSIPIRNASDPWNVVSFTYERDPSEGVYSPGQNFALMGDRVLIDALLPTGPALLTTDDNGATWYALWRGSHKDSGIIGLSFINEPVGWMLQGNGAVRKTTDGGHTWAKVSKLSSELAKKGYSLDFVDSQTGFIVGLDGLILLTNDGGRTWQQRSANTTVNLYKVAAADAKRAWSVGEKGTVLETSDGGANWRRIDLGIEKDLHFNLTVKGGTAWIVSDGFTFHSSS